jgi:hypothetical protein
MITTTNTTNNNNKDDPPLLAEIEKMIIDTRDYDNYTGTEVRELLRRVSMMILRQQQAVIADRARVIKALEDASVWVKADEDGGDNVPLQKALAIIQGEQETQQKGKGKSEKQE